ncbi:MFS transporter [Cellulomonas wangsupingiae]|uniref:MFS transporter n=1 Tax=Cellulomonas wangsupingiae TaxID=2968085 RepID=UPI003556332D
MRLPGAERAVLGDPRALWLFAIIVVRRVAGAAFPVALLIAVADARGLVIAASVQAVRVAVATFSTPLRARLIDRFGRSHVVLPQTIVAAVTLVIFVAIVGDDRAPLALIYVACALAAVTPAAVDAVIRSAWAEIGRTERQVKLLHSVDSLLEEAGFLLGPVLASTLLLAMSPQQGLWAVTAAAVVGSLLVFASSHFRTALRRPPAARPRVAQGMPRTWRTRLRTVVGPIAQPSLRQIVLPLVMMGASLGWLGLLVPQVATAAAGGLDRTGYLMAAISLGGVVGGFGYALVRWRASLSTRHAVLLLAFAAPLTTAVMTWPSAWALGAVLAVSGLAVTPLYINSYLMIDDGLPEEVRHEANTWVPVGNNVGYTIGITAAGLLTAVAPGAQTLAVAQSALAVGTVLIGCWLLRTARSVTPRTEEIAASHAT